MKETEGNKAIAEFMGKTYLENNGDGEIGYLFPINGAFNRRLMPSQMQYHSSWDWLMPVVEKISRIKIEWEDAEYSDTYFTRTFGMLSPNGNPMVRINANQVFEAPTLIEAAWLAVVDFIKSTNTNNLKTKA